MKHIFIINPHAGSGVGKGELKAKLENLGSDFEIYETTGPHDATDYVKKCCAEQESEIRFYACGGDGTVKEVAEGVLGCPHASMSVYPIGSGNDFVKYFGGEDVFKNIEDVTSAPDSTTDIIRIVHDGGETYSVNVCNFGFESYVASVMNRVRRKPIIGGGNAYTTGILCGLFKAMKTRGRVYADGKLLNDSGVLMLGTVANGSHEGGGYKAAPRASVNDGELEVCLVRPLSLITVARLIGIYKKGDHLDDKRFEKYITYLRAKKIEVEFDAPSAIGLDGEIITTKRFTAEVIPDAVRFAAPHKE
ncbi:MAG: hypothetical protein IJA60_01375 [Clostridia bacterium]|nr:hypothetical protein [Clostridia bacterium]